jgi:hypothetical protein
MYYDTTLNITKIYDLGTTTWNRTTPTTAEQATINIVSGISANVTTVAGKATEVGRLGTADAVSDMNTLAVTAIIDDMDTVAGISGNVTTVAGVSSDVTTVAGISADVTAVAADATDIGIVSTNIADVSTVATNIADVIKVADDLNEAISEIETAADDLNEAVSEIDTVATAITNVDNVGNNIANVNTVAGIASDVTTVAGNASNITTVAGVSTDVTTCATNVTAIQDAPDYATDAYNWATRAEDSSHTDSTARTGYSAYHYSEKADASADRAAAWVIEGESAVYAVSTPTDFGSVTDVGSAVFEGESTTSIQLTMSRGSSTYDYGTV